MTNLPSNPYFHSPLNRYPTAPPDDPPAWSTSPRNEEPDEPQESRRSRAKVVAIGVVILAIVAVPIALLI